MLTIICGEDNVESRNFFNELRADYEKKGYEVQNISDLNIDDIPSLFAQKRIYFIENLNKKIVRKNSHMMFQVEKITRSKNIEVVDWEDQISARELKMKGTMTREFKPAQNIFKLLDACYPANFPAFLEVLHTLPDRTEEGFIFIMLVRHIRNLLLVKAGGSNSKLATWQVVKLRHQANHWTLDQLISFYDGLFRIDVSTKTGKNPYTLGKSLDILASYFL